MGFVELIRSGDYSPAEQNEYLDIILRNSSSLAQIIDDILDLSKIESGHFTITRRPVVFSRVIDEVVSLLSVKAKQKNIDIIIESSPDVVDRVMTDEVRLRQILVNIIGNAVKFTSRGYVKVKVGNGGAGILAIEVQDTGIGIPFDKQDRLFRIFSQVDDGAT